MARWKRCMGQSTWEGPWSFHVPWACHFSHTSMCLPLSSSLKAILWVFMEASLHGHDWLNHWRLNSISSPSPLLGGLGWNWKFQPSDASLVSCQPAPILEAFHNQSSDEGYERFFYHFQHLGNSKGLRSSVPGEQIFLRNPSVWGSGGPGLVFALVWPYEHILGDWVFKGECEKLVLVSQFGD